MKKWIWIFVFSLNFLFTFHAKAGLYLEPYIGYSVLSLDASIPVGGLKGAVVGGRIGYALPLIAIAADFHSGNLDAEFGGTTYTGKSTRTGLTLVFSPPVLPFNLLAGYYKASLEANSIDYTGNGSKLGIMFTMLPFLNINAEYYQTAYDESSLRDKGLMLGLSVDFTL